MELKRVKILLVPLSREPFIAEAKIFSCNKILMVKILSKVLLQDSVARLHAAWQVMTSH